jgi:hypothetical protein
MVGGRDDRDTLEGAESQQVLVAGDDVIGRALDGRLQDPVVALIVDNRTLRSSTRRGGLVTSTSCPSSAASRILAGGPDQPRPETMTLESRTTLGVTQLTALP